MGAEPILAQIWELAKNAGPFSTMLVLWLYLRMDGERRDLSKQLMEMTKNIQSINESWLKIMERKKEQT